MNTTLKNSSKDIDEQPPILKTWKRLYTAVLINLALLIGLFYIFGKAFR